VTDLVPVKRALISVSDKSGLDSLASTLAKRGAELISTGGTASKLRESGANVRDISDLTGFPEMMDGRVKTLHPRVHGGLLSIRDNPDHAAAMEEADGTDGHGVQRSSGKPQVTPIRPDVYTVAGIVPIMLAL